MEDDAFEAVLRENAKAIADGLIDALIAWVRCGAKPEHMRDGLRMSVAERARGLDPEARELFIAFYEAMIGMLVYQYREGFIKP